VRCAIAVLLIALGIAWIAVYYTVARDAALGLPASGGGEPSDALPWMADLQRWNYLIGFLLIFAGMTVSAHKSTPVGRGQGVVVGMLFSFLFGLLWILVFYFVGSNLEDVPVMKDLDNYNLVVGIGFMAVGFTFATKWE
jgi:amino acid permease